MANNTQAKNTPAKTPAGKTQKVLRIVARKDGFRRCGVRHPGHAVDHPLDRFTEEQIEILKNDPQLVVHEVEAEVAAPVEAGSEES